MAGTFFKKTNGHLVTSIILIIIGAILYYFANTMLGYELISIYLGLVLILVGIIWIIGMLAKGKDSTIVSKKK